MMMNKKTSVLFAALLGATLLVTACEQPKNAGTPQKSNAPLGIKKPTIGFSVCCEKGLVATIDQFVESVEKEADKQQGKLLQLVANEDAPQEKADLQFEQVKQMIDKGAKSVIVIFVSNRSAAENQEKILKYAEEKNVMIVAGRRAVPKKLFAQFNNLYSVGVSPEVLGMRQGKMVVDQWKAHPEWDSNEDKKMSFAVLRGPQGATQAESRITNSLNTIRKDDQMTSSEQVASENSSWKREDAKRVVAKWIKSGVLDKAEVIVANSDELALGAVDALKEANKPLLPIFGINASQDGLAAVQNNELIGTVLPDSDTMGALTYQVAENLASGKSVDASMPANYQFKGSRTINVQPIVVTKENVNQFR